MREMKDGLHLNTNSDPNNRARFPTPVLQFQDQPRNCPYLPNQSALMPLVYPMHRLGGEEFDAYLATGRRRSSGFLYHTACPNCSACKPTRLPVHDFQWTRSMQRVLKRGDREIETVIGMPQVDEQRVQLFNLHRKARLLGPADDWDSLDDYEQGFVETCCDTVELSFWVQSKLMCISIVDCGQTSVSAVYTYFDPSYSRLSPGTYSILKQIEWAQAAGKTFLYLGMYVEQNAHLRYKGRFVPQQQLVDGRWVTVHEPIEWSDRGDAYGPNLDQDTSSF